VPVANFQASSVLTLESRRGLEMSRLIETYGGEAFHAPAMREVPDIDGFLCGSKRGFLGGLKTVTTSNSRPMLYFSSFTLPHRGEGAEECLKQPPEQQP
jgi:hypothetical protein